MRTCLIILFAVGLHLTVQAQSDDFQIARSRTDQFWVYGTQAGFRPGSIAMQSVSVGGGRFFWFQPQQRTNETARLHLVPSLTAVSCERIKEALLRELGQTDAGGRKIHIQLSEHISEQDLTVVANKYPLGWIYRIEMPVDVSSQRFTEALAYVLIVELANRRANDLQVELPRWLLTGLISHVRAVSLETLTLQSNLQLARNQVRVDPVAALRIRFQQEMPLSFDELSWPNNLATNKTELFQSSAQLFVYELLRLDNGRECMRRFIEELPQHKNWQFAFLSAFKPHFKSLMDVEKWWALKFATFAGRTPENLWSTDESWTRMKAALDVPVQIHLKNDRMPVQAALSLQEVIQTWDPARQEIALRKVVQQLDGVRLRVQPEFVSVVDDYRRVLQKYLTQRTRVGSFSKKADAAVSTTLLRRSTCRELDQIDERRAALRISAFQAAAKTSPQD